MRVQERRRGAVNARVVPVDAFNEVVRSFNEKQGVVASGDETPIALASQQVPQHRYCLAHHS